MTLTKALQRIFVLVFSTSGICHALDAPVALSPGATNAPGPILEMDSTRLRWAPVPGASQYHVALRDVKSNILENYVVLAPSTTREVALTPSRPYRWNVIALVDEEESGISQTLYFQAAVATVRPVITSVLPEPARGIDGAQFLVVNGHDFQHGCQVTLRDKRTGQQFPNRKILVRRSNQLVLEPTFEKPTALWTVEVINPGPVSSREFAFQVVTSDRLAFWQWRKSGWPWAWAFFVGIGTIGVWHLRDRRKSFLAGWRLGHERLSRDLHDSVNDLNQVNLLAGKLKVMTGTAVSVADVQDTAAKVSFAVVEAINGIEDIIWAGHQHNDKLAKLVARLRHIGGRFREHNPNLNCELDFPLEVPERDISSQLAPTCCVSCPKRYAISSSTRMRHKWAVNSF